MGLSLCPSSNARHILGRSLGFSKASGTSPCPLTSHLISKQHIEEGTVYDSHFTDERAEALRRKLGHGGVWEEEPAAGLTLLSCSPASRASTCQWRATR